MLVPLAATTPSDSVRTASSHHHVLASLALAFVVGDTNDASGQAPALPDLPLPLPATPLPPAEDGALRWHHALPWDECKATWLNRARQSPTLEDGWLITGSAITTGGSQLQIVLQRAPDLLHIITLGDSDGACIGTLDTTPHRMQRAAWPMPWPPLVLPASGGLRFP